GLAGRVIGAGRTPSSLERALARGAIDEMTLDFPAAVQRAQVAVFCTPVDRIVEQVLAAAPGCAANTLLTDAGSTKAAIVRSLELRLPPEVAFVGSHPLAGSEKHGPDFADAGLFENRVVVVTRTAYTSEAALRRTQEFWEALGSRVRLMSPEDH